MKPNMSCAYLGMIQNSFEYPDLPVVNFIGDTYNLDVAGLYLGALLICYQFR